MTWSAATVLTPMDVPAVDGDFIWFSDRLQDHSLLCNCSSTAARREPDDLPSGCLVFSDSPIAMSPEGFAFSVRIDGMTAGFKGLPLLGFTRRRPADEPGLHPQVSTCLGASVLIGKQGQAFARDQHEHFVMGFKRPPEHEVETWPKASDLRRVPEPRLRLGDTLRCLYTRDGRLQLWVNEGLILNFDTGRPVDCGQDHFAVVDVCLSVTSVTVLTHAEGVRAGYAKARAATLGNLPELVPREAEDPEPGSAGWGNAPARSARGPVAARQLAARPPASHLLPPSLAPPRSTSSSASAAAPLPPKVAAAPSAGGPAAVGGGAGQMEGSSSKGTAGGACAATTALLLLCSLVAGGGALLAAARWRRSHACN